jgi:hypothetical protein
MLVMFPPSAAGTAVLAIGLALAGCSRPAEPPVSVAVAEPLPSPAARATAAPARARSRVLLGDARAGLLPLACFDEVHGLRAGSSCADLLAVGTVVALAGGARVTLHGPESVRCGESDTVEIHADSSETAGAIGVTPPEARGELLAFPAGHAGAVVLGADERARVREAIVRAAPKAPLDAIEVDQAVSADLDRDGAPDRIYAVTVPVKGRDPPVYAISAVLACRAAAACEAAVTSSVLRLALLGAIDVDGDGWVEIVYRGHHYEGGVTGVARRAGGGWKEIVAEGCGG